MLKLCISSLAFVALVGTAQASSPGCSVNWVNGDCGNVSSDASHTGLDPRFAPPPPVKHERDPKEDDEDKA